MIVERPQSWRLQPLSRRPWIWPNGLPLLGLAKLGPLGPVEKHSRVLMPFDGCSLILPVSTPKSREHLPIEISAQGRVPRRHMEATCTPLRGIPPEQDRDRMFLFDRRRSREEELTEDEGWLVSVEPDAHGELLPSQASNAEFPLWSSLGLRYFPRVRGPRNVELLAPYAHRNQSLNLRLLTTSILDETKGSVRDLLNDLDRNILDIELITTPDGRRPAIAIRHKISGVVPVSVLGDGIRRALSIALSVRKARDGILLIDELEAALHVYLRLIDCIPGWSTHAEIIMFRLLEQLIVSMAIDAVARLASDGRAKDIAASLARSVRRRLREALYWGNAEAFGARARLGRPLTMAHTVLVVEGAHDASFFGQLIRARGYKRAGTLSDVPEFWMPLIPRRYPTDPAGRLDRVIQFPEIHVSNDGDTLGIIVAGGEERLIEGLRTPLEQLGPSFAGIGMALDTDQYDPHVRLGSTCSSQDLVNSNADASAEGTPGFPLELPREPGVAVAGPPKLGVYLFPDNMRQGTLWKQCCWNV